MSNHGGDGKTWEGAMGCCPERHRSCREVVPPLVISESVGPVVLGLGVDRTGVGQGSPAMAASRLSLMTFWSINS